MKAGFHRKEEKMKKFLFLIKQLLPFTYWSKFSTPDGKKYLTIWRQWFGISFNVNKFSLKD